MGVSARLLQRFDPDQPRDEDGKWTSGGGADKPSGGQPSGGSSFRPPSKDQIEKWDKQIGARQAELEKEGKLGDKEDTELQRMSGALGHYARAKPEDIASDRVGINVVYDDDKLYAAVSTQYDPKKNAAEITFAGGLDREARATALQSAREHYEQTGAERVEGNEFVDDVEAIKSYEDAGFRRTSEGAGVVTMVWGVERTHAELQSIAEAEKAHVQMVRGMANSVARDLSFDAAKITLGEQGEKDQNFVLNGKQYKAAGIAYTRSTDPALKGTIKIFPSQIWDEKAAQGVTAHEIEHIKFQNAYDRYQKEREAVMDEPGPPPNPDAEHHWDRVGGLDAVMRPDGMLRPPYDEKYPVYQLMEQAYGMVGAYEFAAGDGVSPYSDEYWKQWESNEKTAEYFRSGMHETLAEMARSKYTTGKFPEHKGATRKAKDDNAKLWRALYRAVDKIQDLP
jgi:hypothetical protein